MESQFYVAWFVTALFWAVVFGGICYYVADQKHRDPGLWMLIGALSGLIGLIVLAAIPAGEVRTRTGATGGFCAQCGTTLNGGDRFCRSCGSTVTA